MKTVLRIMMFPVVFVLDLVTWICVGLLNCSVFLFSLAGTVIGILAVAVLLTYSVTNGLILLTLAFLVSPLGLPMLAAWMLSGLQNISLAIRSI